MPGGKLDAGGARWEPDTASGSAAGSGSEILRISIRDSKLKIQDSGFRE
jgi:hypothetical protein